MDVARPVAHSPTRIAGRGGARSGQRRSRLERRAARLVGGGSGCDDGRRPHAVHDLDHLLEHGHHLPIVFGAAIDVRAFPLLTYERDDFLQLLFMRFSAFTRQRVRVAVRAENKRPPLN